VKSDVLRWIPKTHSFGGSAFIFNNGRGMFQPLTSAGGGKTLHEFGANSEKSWLAEMKRLGIKPKPE
jgi:hypothetical protein